MPVPFNDGASVAAPRYFDLRQGKLVGSVSVPYASTAEALSSLVSTRRAEGLIVYVQNGSVVEQWQFQNGITNGDLVNITSSGLYSLPIASDIILGGIKVGTGLVINPSTGVLTTTVALFTPKSVPFADGSGILTEDPIGLNYDGTDLHVGLGDFASTSGLILNDGRAEILASGDGLIIRTKSGDGSSPDSSKTIRYYNGPFEYFRNYSAGAGPFTHYTLFNTFFLVGNLATGGTPPTTVGTTSSVITDANGQLSFRDLVRVVDNFADDAAAAIGGIGVGKLYHTSGTVRIRLS